MREEGAWRGAIMMSDMLASTVVSSRARVSLYIMFLKNLFVYGVDIMVQLFYFMKKQSLNRTL